ncbi:hypothetical protein ACEV9L_24900 [Vibrio parahaemolyticus]
MDIDEYFNQVECGVGVCTSKSISSEKYVEELLVSSPELVKEIIYVRKEILCSSDYEKLSGYLEIGVFTDFSREERLALFSFMFDIGDELKLKLFRDSFERYQIDQLLFSGEEDLFDCIRKTSAGKLDLELVDSKYFENIQGSEIFRRNGSYFKIDKHLNPAICSLCSQIFPNSPLFIRLDPTKRYSSQPLFQLNEEILIPANPSWWKNSISISEEKKVLLISCVPKSYRKNHIKNIGNIMLRGYADLMLLQREITKATLA